MKSTPRIYNRNYGAPLMFLLFVIGYLVGFEVYHYYVFPITIDQRASNLGMMRYSYADGGMIPNDDSKFILHYLKHGSMK